MKRIFLLCALLICTLPVFIYAKIELPPMFSDNMVLQQQAEAPIWGKSNPNKEVKVITSWNNKEYKAKADADGNWKLMVGTPKAGGPYSIKISDGKQVQLNNVMIGEVWVCSGQSNMEMQIEGWGKVYNYEQEKTNATYPNIRFLQVKKNTSPQPINDLDVTGGGWQVCSPETVADFSAVAYFFGRDIHQSQNVPIGLIDTSWGGTYAETWTSAESLELMPELLEPLNKVKQIPVSKEGQDILYKSQMDEWEKVVREKDPGFDGDEPLWSTLEVNTSDWRKMPVPGFYKEVNPQLKDFDGIVWLRKEIEIPANWAGKELILNLGAIDDIDYTYFNGVQIGKSDGWNVNRQYKIPGKLVKKGKAVIAVRVLDTGGDGGIWESSENVYIQRTNKDRQVLAGQWEYKVAFALNQVPSVPRNLIDDANNPSLLFNAMLNPLIPYSIAGAIWYQGEANTDRAYRYRDLFPLMINDWRTKWGYDFPFYFVQLANFMRLQEEPVESTWAELREAQQMTLNLGNTGMAVTIDIGDANDIHPKNKQDVGKRLALWARAKTYNENIPYSGPIYDSYKIEGNKIRISFKHTDGGLKTIDNQTLKGFVIAGLDHKFHWAEAVIDGNEIVVSSPDVSFPLAVRYGWADNPIVSLYNGAGLPASPFRTDDWKGITVGK